MRIQVVCGAGASSTFIASRLRKAALERGLSWTINAGVVDVIDVSADLVLLGSHLRSHIDQLAKLHPGLLMVPLPMDAATDRNGTQTLALALNATNTSAPKTTNTNTNSTNTQTTSTNTQTAK